MAGGQRAVGGNPTSVATTGGLGFPIAEPVAAAQGSSNSRRYAGVSEAMPGVFGDPVDFGGDGRSKAKEGPVLSRADDGAGPFLQLPITFSRARGDGMAATKGRGSISPRGGDGYPRPLLGVGPPVFDPVEKAKRASAKGG